MNSVTEYDMEKMLYRTTFSMSAEELSHSFADMGDQQRQAAAAMRKMSEQMEHEAFYGKPTIKPAPYAVVTMMPVSEAVDLFVKLPKRDLHFETGHARDTVRGRMDLTATVGGEIERMIETLTDAGVRFTINQHYNHAREAHAMNIDFETSDPSVMQAIHDQMTAEQDERAKDAKVEKKRQVALTDQKHAEIQAAQAEARRMADYAEEALF